MADLQEANTNDIAIEDDIELASAVDEIEISDADSAEIDAIGEVIGGIGGGGLEIASPTAWSEAVNGGIEQWFSMFDRQRQASRSPCYALSLLMEYRDKFQRPAQTYRLAEDLAQAEVDYANQLWQAEIGQAALAEAVFAVVDLRAFVTITDWVVAGQEQRIRRIRGFLPARRSDVINQEPNNYRTVTDPGVQPPGCDDWAKRGCWIKVADGLYYARASNQLVGPRLLQLYDAIAANPPPDVVLATQAGRRFAALSARWEVLEAIKAEYDYQLAWLMPQCLAERQGNMPGIDVDLDNRRRDPRDTGTRNTDDTDADDGAPVGLLLVAVLLGLLMKGSS